jgi:predicted SAM-dependent methyltransferase
MDGTTTSLLRLHIGCGERLLPGWVNADRVARVPGVRVDLDLTALPYSDGSVEEILAEHVLEHLSFAEEALAWPEMARVLRPAS